MEALMGGLSALRKRCGPEQWDELVQTHALCHPVSRLIWQDPFTEHSFRKPRGYPGDAVLLDYIYGDAPLPPRTSDLGAAIFRFNRDRQAPRSVRWRRRILTQMIDQSAARVRSPKILSIACGHLREATDSSALAAGGIGEFIALDQDLASLRQVQSLFGERGVKTVHGSVRSILAQKLSLGTFDLIYAAGLYDYLADRVAARLTTCLFDMLAAGGQLLIANFAPRLNDIGYIESFMAWKLIYRDPIQLAALCADIDSSRWSSQRLFWDGHESIVFLELTKQRRMNGSLTLAEGLKSVAVPTASFTIAPALARGCRLGGDVPR